MKKNNKVYVKLTEKERRLLIEGMMRFRNRTIQAGYPTDDIDEILIRIIK